ncbi:MAG: carbonic anhydrase [Chromatiales bacterium]|nr:carbonic anhydrase [Chromatiales bacterium]
MRRSIEALARLREGNARFVAETSAGAAHVPQTGGQSPFAIVLGCSDSRVPVETVFDQGFGDLFVVRVAGNIVAPSQVGSIEFAAERYGTRLVVVLGHSQCGAVAATLEQLGQPMANRSPNLRSIVGRIQPAVETLVETRPDLSAEEMLHHAVRANVRASVSHLRHGSASLERLIENDWLRVVGAEYSIETGAVEFFEGV